MAPGVDREGICFSRETNGSSHPAYSSQIPLPLAAILLLKIKASLAGSDVHVHLTYNLKPT